MLKSFLAGLACGTVVAIAVFVMVAGFPFRSPEPRQAEIADVTGLAQAPRIPYEDDYFPGGCIGPEFDYFSSEVLAAGAGRIVGRVTVKGRGVAGIRLRLALDGSAYSQWADTEADGAYSVEVPVGTYELVGYDLDTGMASLHLSGKMASPRNVCYGGLVEVEEDRPGQGPELDFVDPIRLTAPIARVRIDGPIVATWDPYPGAEAYKVQVFRLAGPDTWMDAEALFEFDNQPRVSGERMDLATVTDSLLAGHHYGVHVTALDGDGLPIGSTHSPSRGNQFHLVD